MKKTYSKNNGITLIALAVAIVVLIILAGITIIKLSGDNGILNRSQLAATSTKEQSAREKVKLMMGQYGVQRDTQDKTLETFLNEQKAAGKIDEIIKHEDGTFSVKTDGCEIIIDEADLDVANRVDRPGLKVGDYIDYQPDKESDGGYKVYSKDNLNKDITGDENNTSNVNQEDLDWQILKLNLDGGITLVGSPISSLIYFTGVTAYNNGVYAMNDLCEKLYSHGDCKARSINIADINYWLTDAGKNVRGNYKSSGNVKYGESKNYPVYKSYPSSYEYENETGNEFAALTNETYKVAGSSGLTLKETYWFSGAKCITDTYFGDGAKAINNPIYYWVASRCSYCDSTFGTFGLRYCGDELSGAYLFTSRNETYGNCARLRPVVKISPNAKIKIKSGTISDKHKIEQY